MPDLIRNTLVIVRKARKCFACLTMLNAGETAMVGTNVDEGRIYDITLCESCNSRWKGEYNCNTNDVLNYGDYAGREEDE